MDQVHLDALRVSLPTLASKLNSDLDPLLNILYSKKVLSETSREVIQASNVPYKNKSELVRFLQKKPPDVYLIFKQALKSTEQDGCLAELEKNENEAFMKIEISNMYQNAELKDSLWSCFNVIPLNLRNKYHDDKNVYKCNPEGTPKGLALIINNVEFVTLDTRIGSDNDSRRIEQLLIQLDYTIVKHDNKTKEEMEEVITEFKNDGRHEQADSTVVVILSHGEHEKIYGTDDELMQLEFLKTSLNTEHLKGKPKLIFIQACREKPLLKYEVTLPSVKLTAAQTSNLLRELESTYFRETDILMKRLFPKADDNLQTDGPRVPKIDADYLVAYSTTPGYVSYRGGKGSVFIQTLCSVIAECAETKHILDMLIMVNQRVAAALRSDQEQISEQTLSLTKQFYFHKRSQP